MTRDVFTLPAEISAAEAAWGLNNHGVSGAPVRAFDGKLIGTLSTSELADPDRRASANEEPLVGDVMTPALFTIFAHEPALHAVLALVRKRVHRLVVLDGKGDLAGIVTPMDVLTAIANGERFDDEKPNPPHHLVARHPRRDAQRAH